MDSAIFQMLTARFDTVKPLGGNRFNVGCPYCKKRGMGEDGSGRSPRGHLGLDFDKNVAYCVRCAAPIGNLRRWLRTKYNADLPDLPETAARSSMQFFRESTAARLSSQVLKVPAGCRFIDKEDRASWPFAESLLEKSITWDQIERAQLQYATDGRLAGYVFFPFFEDEELVYWQGRAAWKELDADPSRRKKNPGKEEAPLGKTCWLYGVDDATFGGEFYLCEGALDRITLHDFVQTERGPSACAMSLQGTSFDTHTNSAERHPLNTQLGKILVLQPRLVCVLFDGPKGTDKGAYEKAVMVAQELQECGINAYAGKLSRGDPNENASNLGELRRAIEPPPEASAQDNRWANEFETLSTPNL